MSGSNPFSKADASEHNLVSKIVGSGPFHVAVDLVDIDTAYIYQLGSAVDPTEQAFIKQIGTAANPVNIEFVTKVGTYANPVSEIDVTQLYATTIGSPMFPTTNIYTTNLGTTGDPVTQAYISDIGDSGVSGNAFFDVATIGTLFCTNIIPAPGGGSGGIQYQAGTGIGITYTSPTNGTINSLVRGTTGIGVAIGPGNYWDVTNLGVLSVTGGTGIAVDNTDPQKPKIFSTSQSGVTGIGGGTGIQILNGNSQFPTIFTNNIQNISAGTNITIDFTNPLIPSISASGGGTGGNPIGPQGQVAYFTPTGLQSVPQLKYDGTTLNAPSIQVVSESQTGMLGFSTSAGDSSIFSGLTNSPNVGNYLNIGKFQGTPTMTIDTIQGFVGINKTPTVALDVVGQTVLTYAGGDVFNAVTGGSGPSGSVSLSAGATYIVRAWGAGGAGNGGAGGAGGYAEVTFFAGSTGNLQWSQLYGGPSGGGNALIAGFSGTTFLYVPGGGAGATGGSGAAAGEPYGLPNPAGGYSSGYIGTSIATYTDNTPWLYDTLTNTSVTGGTFAGGTIYTLAGNVTSGMTLTFDPPAGLQTSLPSGTTYRTAPGTTFTIQAPSLSFFNSLVTSTENGFVLSPGFSPIVNNGVPSGLTGTTGSANYTNWPGVTYPTFSGNPSLSGTTGLTGSSAPVTTGPINITVVSGVTYTWFFNGGISEILPNETIVLSPGTTFNFSLPSLGVTGTSITTTGNVIIPAGTDIRVANRIFTNQGLTATNQNGVNNGGGGITGGGSSALVTGVPGVSDSLVIGTTFNRLAGGGAGSWFIDTGYTGTTYSGSGSLPYVNQYNRYGVYGAGTTGANGNPGFLIVETVTTPAVAEDALEVNGTVTINGTNNALKMLNGSILAAGVQSTTGFIGVTGSTQIQALFPVGLTSSAGCGVGSLTLVAGGTAQNFYAPPGTLQTFGRVNINADPSGGPVQGYALTVSGASGSSFAHDAYGSDFIIRSDSRLKENIVTVDSALDKVMKMRGVYFNKSDDPTRRIGVIAQEVEQVLPEVVHTDDTPEQMKAVSYANIVGLLIEAVKEQQEMIKKLME